MTGRRKGPAGAERSAARLACVQVLYEMEVSGATLDPVLEDYMADRWQRLGQPTDLAKPDRAFLTRLVRGVSERLVEIDAAIEAALASDLDLDRLEVLLRAILRAGTFELIALPKVPTKVVINEYTELAHAFFFGREPGLVNAVLDRVARSVRPQGRRTDGGEDDPQG